MINTLRLLFTILIAATVLGISPDWVRPTSMIAISREDYLKNRELIQRKQMDVSGIDVEKNEVYLVVNATDRADLMASRIDLFDQQKLLQTDLDDRYQTPDEVAARLAEYQKRFPTLASYRSFGRSVEGREMLVLKIAFGTGPKPTILINGMHHSREVMTTEVALDMADYLLENYARDPRVTKWINDFDIYIVPMMNVDGNHRVWDGDRMWRKNTAGRFGVDLNRNYPFSWNTCNGSSGFEMAQDYRGPTAGSEPETQAMMNLIAEVRPVFDLSLHSFSELVIYPYGCGQHTDQKDVVEPIGQQLARLIPRDDGNGTYRAGTPPELLYAADGGDIDWMYHEQGVIPYVIEVNGAEQGFQPDYDQWRNRTVQKLRPAWQYLLERMNGPSIEGSVAPGVAVAIDGRSYKPRADGYFRVLVNPGVHTVEVRNGGGVVSQQRVQVGPGPVRVFQ